MIRDALTIPRLLVLSFLAIIVIGALLLLLPYSTAEGAPGMTVVDALFTSTSAVCVTGLVVRDTPSQFTFFGELVLLALIQVGGLGIMTVSNYFLLIAGRRLGLSDRETLQTTHGALPQINPRKLLRKIILYTFAIEAIGAVFLVYRFSFDFPLGTAVWYGIFHSVSAFCNAGFALFTNSLMDYHNDVIVNVTVMALVVLGGLGFVVFAELRLALKLWTRGLRHRLSLHTRVVLVFTLILGVGGGLLMMLFEYDNPTRDQMTLPDLFMHAMFLSIAARTAGFNTVDIPLLTNSSLMLTIIWMFIGAAPGSTGGGIKITSIAVLYALVSSRMRARPRVELFDRTLPLEVIGKAAGTIVGFILTATVALLALEWTELGSAPSIGVQGKFLQHLFEVISATGTVGLSMGVTGDLSYPGRIVLCFCMFFGRLGPLIMGASLIGRKRSIPYSLPNETIVIG